MTEEEVNVSKRAEAAERRAQGARPRRAAGPVAARRGPSTRRASIVNAITFAARRGLHRYLDRHAGELRAELAHRHGVRPSGSSSATARAAAAAPPPTALLEPGDELVTPWPSYPLYPADGARAPAGTPFPSPGFARRARCCAAVNDRTRIVALCNPNDPTGELLGAGAAARAARRRCPSASSSCSTRRCATTSTRRAGRRSARAARGPSRGCSSSARSPRPGAWPACASATRSAARAPSRCSSASTPRARRRRARPGRRARGAAHARGRSPTRAAPAIAAARDALPTACAQRGFDVDAVAGQRPLGRRRRASDGAELAARLATPRRHRRRRRPRSATPAACA